jgi:translocator protein
LEQRTLIKETSISILKKLIAIIICIAIPLAVGGISGIAPSGSENQWYESLEKPAFNPPDWLFGPVWTILYILMGVSLFLIWKSPPSPTRNLALIVFGIQLVLNAAWSFIFFYFQQPGWALADIILLWGFILAMIIVFSKIHRIAAYLQVPYLLWVTFAVVLNASIWWLN